jgi:membrane fusion protein, multidrug efflux system
MDSIATKATKLVGGFVSAVIVLGAIMLGLVVIYRTNHNPRTDDSEILANFIGKWRGRFFV